MNRKHFIGIAEILFAHRDEPNHAELVNQFADFGVEHNDNFNREVFLTACGLGE